MLRRSAFGVLPLLFAFACSSSTDDPEGPGTAEKVKPTPLPALASVTSTAEATLTPTQARQSYMAGPNPAIVPEDLQSYLERGFGEQAASGGQAYAVRAVDGSTPPAAGPNAKRMLRFVHLADMQLADDESPTRVGQLDSAGFTSSALRPHDAYLCHMANAAVRTINGFHRKDPIAFTLLGGDNADSAQTNEVDWVLGILSGSPEVECDSGEDDDMISGPGNDGKDPFVAEGLAMPWKWVTGNHDVLVQGNVAVNEFNKQAAIGDSANNGTREYRTLKGGISTDVVPADPRRALLAPPELMSKVAGDKDGHGLGAAEKASGRATYTFDAEGSNFRFLVIDTSHHSGGSDGVIRQADIDSTIKPLLDKAKADGKWVILSSHHATSSLTLEGGALGTKEPDALLPEAWMKFIGGYPNVLFSMVGHSHEHRVRGLAPQAGHAWWEVMTAAIADFPHQFRVVEIYDQDNGWLMMKATAADFSVEGDPVAADGRRRGTVDFTSGWLPDDGRGKTEDRNVELWIKKPL